MSLESYVTGLMKEPAPKGMDRLVLSGLSQLEKMYFAQVEKKRTADMAAAVSAHVPVISVGNITAGGTGKTPCILMLAELFCSIGKKPAIISRGDRKSVV